MRYLIILLLVLTLVACASQPVNIPVPVTPTVTAQPIGPLPIKKLIPQSSPGTVLSAAFQTIYMQRDYINYLLTIGSIKVLAK